MQIILYRIMNIVFFVHNYILSVNDACGWNFTDKDLHFLVVGTIGCVIMVVSYAILKVLRVKKMAAIVSWTASLATVALLAFAIEVGQDLTNTGNFELLDILYGVLGFVFLSLPFCAILLSLDIVADLQGRRTHLLKE